MKRILGAFAVLLAFGAASLDADAARRFGGGSNLGKQRATPMQRDATPAQPAAPAKAAPANTPAAPAAGAAAAAKPSFMSRWGGMLAGLGIGVLLASLFGEQLGPIVGLLLAGLLAVGVVLLLLKLFAGRRGGNTPMPASGPTAFSGMTPAPARDGARPGFSGIGSGVPGAAPAPVEPAAPRSTAVALPPDVELAPFLRVAKTSFIRLQAANDAGDLDDIRDYTTPEMYAEISMQLQDRGAAAQRTEVVNLEAQLIDFAREDGFDIASVRFYGLIREQAAANPEPFDEIWHVRRKAGDRKDPWLIAGIQQN